jgi:hypothetical protein
MSNNFYWPIYKNLERELTELSNLIHIDDKQLEIYSIKIAELLLRTSIEIESISKVLYFENGGTKEDDNNLFFDSDCLNLLEALWQLSKKQIQISATNFYFTELENITLTPLRKANKRGASSSDWQKAYQAVKHNRVTSLPKANLKHLIRAMGALYILNLYYNNNEYPLKKDSGGLNFDSSQGSSIFSVKLHINTTIAPGIDYSKNPDYDEYIYVLKPTDETRNINQQKFKEINEIIAERTKASLIKKATQQSGNIQNKSRVDAEIVIKAMVNEIHTENMIQVAKENAKAIQTVFESLRYEAVLNKQQY